MDSCSSLIVYGGTEAAAREAFERWLLTVYAGEAPESTKIGGVVAAPVLDELLTENGSVPLDWPRISEEAQHGLEAGAAGDFEQGYWVDCEQVVRPRKLGPNLEWLQRELPEEVRSGLNWSTEKNYFFLISVLKPPAAQPEFVEENSDVLPEEEGADALFGDHSPEDVRLAETELAVLVRARNSAIAAWLWWRSAAAAALADNAIQIEPWCGSMAVGQ